ncbi:glycine--tRNA ligase subunit beta [Levilactobacillus bambusae]|uniref:Glycine--tRNA ligase beta subunit n=1 Tax=Levilactobacillus bambusae TaxID=2024736 RepID=A0A2V1N0N3_9LACO|nr:glycine--tRNA ligase subunit beta [Levilactobacillus bambusae]PWG00774.1 glycine--tRNA ligase subunit beta [Levilactobacillus bambusae]
MAHTFLLEIGLEEVPAHVVTPSIKQLVKRAGDFLKDQRLAYETIKPFSTPRRLAIEVTGLADKQEDISESVKGPAKKIAQDADGNWTKAAIGFTKGQGLSVDDITFKEVKGTEYVYVDKFTAGKTAGEVLEGMKEVVTSMTFPTMMKWGVNHFDYIRPIRWLVAMLDGTIIPFNILDVQTGNTTRGHRFLGHEAILKTATDYEDALMSEYVVVDAAKRKQIIMDQINQIASDNAWLVNPDQSLLEEVNNLVEWPTAFAGAFDKKYLTIPEEVLITSMRDHQRFFYARNQAGELMPNFISVRNGTDHMIENVVAGNEKVLTARLEDAMFFYQEDQKKTIDDYVNRLDGVSFHDKISSMYDKMMRTKAIANVLADKFGLSEQERADVNRAADIYKFDLVTGMVGEFAELQGVMGEKYALLQGETTAVAQAVREHYLPISADGDLPESTVGAVLAVADKFDSILAFFGANMIPSGSNDPYALRRQATGIIRIAREHHWHLPINTLLPELVSAEDAAEVNLTYDQLDEVPAILDFFRDRVAKMLKNDGVRHDIIDAVTAGSNSDILDLFEDARILTAHQDDANFKAVIEALTRVIRISKKADQRVAEQRVNPELFENEAEAALHDAVQTLPKAAENGLSTLYEALAALQPIIDHYFDDTMVMAEDEAVRNNRLAELSQLAVWTYPLGDLDLLIVK